MPATAILSFQNTQAKISDQVMQSNPDRCQLLQSVLIGAHPCVKKECCGYCGSSSGVIPQRDVIREQRLCKARWKEKTTDEHQEHGLRWLVLSGAAQCGFDLNLCG